MSSTLGNNYVGAIGPNGIRVWRPTVFPAGAIQAQQGAAVGTTPPPSNTGNPSTGGSDAGGKDGDGNVYAAALFFSATCQASDAVGNTVRADTSVNSVISVSCYQPYPAIGIIVAKKDDTHCVVQTYGICANVYSGLTSNDRYFVGNTSHPSLGSQLPQDGAYVQAIGFAVQPGAIFIQPTGIIFRRYTGTGASSPAPGQQPGAPSSGDTVKFIGGRILHGEDPPDAGLGDVDDEYLQTIGDNGRILWGPKTDSGWGAAGLNLVGQTGETGMAGPAGPEGAVGPAGPQGDAGPVGATGPQGATGSEGPLGATGATGAAGPQGDRGDMGVAGPPGPAGVDGQKGDIGATGAQGPQGIAGDVGPAGATGPAGQNGTRIYVGDGPPDDNNNFETGSFYFDRQNKQLYPPDA